MKDPKIAVLFLVIIASVAFYWAIFKGPKDNSHPNQTKTNTKKRSTRKSDFVSDYYLNRRFGKRK